MLEFETLGENVVNRDFPHRHVLPIRSEDELAGLDPSKIAVGGNGQRLPCDRQRESSDHGYGQSRRVERYRISISTGSVRAVFLVLTINFILPSSGIDGSFKPCYCFPSQIIGQRAGHRGGLSAWSAGTATKSDEYHNESCVVHSLKSDNSPNEYHKESCEEFVGTTKGSRTGITYILKSKARCCP